MLLRHSTQIRTLRVIQVSIYQTLILYIKKEKLAKTGGILIYLKNDIKFEIIKDLSVSDGDNECVTVEIENKNSKNLLITCCYRPPIGAIKLGSHWAIKFNSIAKLAIDQTLSPKWR